MVKKVVITKGKFKDYIDEIRHSYELGFPPCRLHTNVGVFVTPIRVYSGRVFVLDDVATMEIGDHKIAADEISSKLVYFVKGDSGSGGSGAALQGDRGPSGTRGLKGDSGPLEVEVQLENVALKGLKVLLERLVKWNLLEAEVKLEHVEKKVTREILVVLVNKHL